jgi:hypothetical protein
MGEALETAPTHSEVWTKWPLLTGRGINSCYPYPGRFFQPRLRAGSRRNETQLPFPGLCARSEEGQPMALTSDVALGTRRRG